MNDLVRVAAVQAVSRNGDIAGNLRRAGLLEEAVILGDVHLDRQCRRTGVVSPSGYWSHAAKHV